MERVAALAFRATGWQGTGAMRLWIIAAMVAALLTGSGCASRMPILNPDPRSPEEYATDREVCVWKHSFGQGPAQCLHCELFLLCMEKQMWRMDAGPDGGLPCCRGTEKPAS